MDQVALDEKVRNCARPVNTVLSLDYTVNDAIKHVRKNGTLDNLAYFYVVDDRRHLLGTVNTKDLLINAPNTPLSKIIRTRTKTILGSHTLLEALEIMQHHHLVALPVIENGRFLGVVDIQTYFTEEITIDTLKRKNEIFQIMGLILQEKGVTQSTWKKYYSRMPWLLCNMLGGLGCAIIAEFYQVVLQQVLVLAMFIPLVLSLSESISMQSMTQSLYEVHKHVSFWKQSMYYVWKESWFIGLVALTCSALIGIISLFWGGGIQVAITIGASILISMLITALIGALVPLVLHVWKWDPKIASGPIVLMCADVITTLLYLSFAFWWLVR